MDQHLRVLRDTEIREHLQRAFRAVHAFGPAFDDCTDFRVAAFVHQTLDLVAHLRIHHDDDIRDSRVVFEGLDAPAHHRLIGHSDQLFGVLGIETGAEPGSQYHGDHRDLGWCGGRFVG